MKSYRLLALTGGILGVLCYLAFAILAWSRYPQAFSPANNWLSDLGNPTLNPHGAFFYNSGVVVTGLLLLAFFVGLWAWRIESNGRQRFLLRLTQALGALGALAMLLSGVYPETFPELHGFLSGALYILIGTAFVFSVFALRYVPACPRWLLFFGVLTGAVDILYGALHNVRPLEWATVALFLCYVCVLAIQTARLESAPSTAETTPSTAHDDRVPVVER
jgi:hypothetical membrane protein